MKPEFLQNFKVGDTPLPKEVVDAILAENGRDVEAAVKPFADYESIKERLRTATEGLKAFEGVDVKDLQGQVTKLTRDLADQAEAHKQQLADLAFDSTLKDAITAARGRNVKAIQALLDVDKLKASKDQTADIKAALEGLKKDNGSIKNRPEGRSEKSDGDGSEQCVVYLQKAAFSVLKLDSQPVSPLPFGPQAGVSGRFSGRKYMLIVNRSGRLLGALKERIMDSRPFGCPLISPLTVDAAGNAPAAESSGRAASGPAGPLDTMAAGPGQSLRGGRGQPSGSRASSWVCFSSGWGRFLRRLGATLS